MFTNKKKRRRYHCHLNLADPIFGHQLPHDLLVDTLRAPLSDSQPISLHIRIRLHRPQPIHILIWMIRPLMFLLINIQPHNTPVGIFTPHDPPLYAKEYPTMRDTLGIEPLCPLLQIYFRAHAIRDGIPALLCDGLARDVARFDDEVRGSVLAHFGKELVVWGEVVVLGQGGEREDSGVEGVGLDDG